MAVGLKQPGKLYPVLGLELATTAAGIRYQGRDDLLVIRLSEGANVSAVFTQNKCCAAPVTLAKAHMAESETRALLINSGNANAVTGELGMQNASQSCAELAKLMGFSTEQVLPFSTGVIGEQLNMLAMNNGIQSLVGPHSVGQFSDNNWLRAAQAIMTTDTVAKAVSCQLELGGDLITITGITKGSGMICPNMATMLAYVATDANISKQNLDALLMRGTQSSFNRITVDSDTSTNDALVLMATGKAQAEPLTGDSLEGFYQQLESVLVELATSIIRDGEGATKFVKVEVSGGCNQSDCSAIAYSIAHSPLVKTALFASDPNWGRILMALGKAPVESLDMSLVDIQIGCVSLIEKGQPAPSYTEEAGKSVFVEEEIHIHVALNQGSERFHVWTSDLSHEYVSINADYRS
ncbi:MAG: bifunctional glutamate N-acetyltransferase/amino-acid acetyltransferase ArgJ [Arenicella sp.]|nr:bifunctional glutamate N-acetyltransferase/amino-acid acetyltransferase ArgJ [Arenicella sp.]